MCVRLKIAVRVLGWYNFDTFFSGNILSGNKTNHDFRTFFGSPVDGSFGNSFAVTSD